MVILGTGHYYQRRLPKFTAAFITDLSGRVWAGPGRDHPDICGKRESRRPGFLAEDVRFQADTVDLVCNHRPFVAALACHRNHIEWLAGRKSTRL